MTIYSWNMLYYNRELDRALEFIAASDFDIFCLQEVPETFLKQLQTLPCFIASQSERELHLEEDIRNNYVVILSKHPLTAHDKIPFPDYWPLLPFRVRLFVRLMPSRLFTRVQNRGGMYADVTMPGVSIRVFNLHIILARPALRLKEFEVAMAERDPSRPTIVCGDFNVIESPRTSLLNWILGGSVADALLYRRERTHIEKRFVEHQLVNPLYGGVTHPLSQSQLDHILVSNSFSIKKASVLSDRMGSDHHPIRVEVE